MKKAGELPEGQISVIELVESYPHLIKYVNKFICEERNRFVFVKSVLHPTKMYCNLALCELPSQTSLPTKPLERIINFQLLEGKLKNPPILEGKTLKEIFLVIKGQVNLIVVINRYDKLIAVDLLTPQKFKTFNEYARWCQLNKNVELNPVQITLCNIRKGLEFDSVRTSMHNILDQVSHRIYLPHLRSLQNKSQSSKKVFKDSQHKTALNFFSSNGHFDLSITKEDKKIYFSGNTSGAVNLRCEEINNLTLPEITFLVDCAQTMVQK